MRGVRQIRNGDFVLLDGVFQGDKLLSKEHNEHKEYCEIFGRILKLKELQGLALIQIYLLKSSGAEFEKLTFKSE